MAATDIDGVLAELTRIVDRAERDELRTGYFAALYREVTRRVKADLETGRFSDPTRMERLDVVFANRYLEALSRYRDGGSPTRSWEVALEATTRWSPLILQHLLAGMNAHINLDLGIAAEEVSPEGELGELEDDFAEINDILGRMIDGVQRRLVPFSPWIGVLDRVGGEADEVVSNFCLRKARRDAWSFARALSKAGSDQRPVFIEEKDRETARRTEKILDPGGPWMQPVLWAARLRESSDPTPVIRRLSGWA